jgi:ATP-dependent DNA ligase
MWSSTFLDYHGRPSFNLLQNRRLGRDAVQFYAFDLLAYGGHSLLGVPLAKRREWLKAALKRADGSIKLSDALHAEVDLLIAAAR